MKKKVTFKKLWKVLKNSFKGFSNDRITKMSSSLSYYTLFSMAPLLIIIISLSGIFLGQDAAQGKIYDQLSNFIGSNAASQLQTMIQNASLSGKSKLAAIIGIVTLIVGATTVFAQIQDTINYIWGIKPKPKKSWLNFLKNRFLSFSVIIGLAFLLLVSLTLSTLIDGFSDALKAHFPQITVVFLYIINTLITLIVTALIFGAIFKVLPDAKIRWKDVLTGAITTAVLFMLAKFGISFYISKSNVGTTYGAAGSLVILLLWVYFSAMILYFGAEFTKAYAVEFGAEIRPDDYAVTTKIVEVEVGKKSIQEKENTELKTHEVGKKS
ncbi:YihY/virulence factor BrkB family protein [Hanamia caeni]|jgi:membrane protein|uniref:YihY/virulence factor BrkB family protein n=1 Tax=Hanamia caeni TaxID=2294116 RepID=A0A3M9NK20_9BACT|nr:YihY/virulence factor BrkB family protein [Hanamia caeni]RNI38051.1 YihY/virulence factor BrkB family protein [Hanamia caeni]